MNTPSRLAGRLDVQQCISQDGVVEYLREKLVVSGV